MHKAFFVANQPCFLSLAVSLLMTLFYFRAKMGSLLLTTFPRQAYMRHGKNKIGNISLFFFSLFLLKPKFTLHFFSGMVFKHNHNNQQQNSRCISSLQQTRTETTFYFHYHYKHNGFRLFTLFYKTGIPCYTLQRVVTQCLLFLLIYCLLNL